MDANAPVEENGRMELTESGKQDGNLGDDFLEDFDSCWQDITDRLTISRLVSDSVIKGMVNAISQEAHEKITQKELEVSELKKILQSYHLGPNSENTKFLAFPLRSCEPKCTEFDRNDSIRGAFFEHDGMTESMCSLRNTAKENLNKLKKEIDRIRGCNSIRNINSGSEFVGLGLGGLLQEKASSRCIDLDKIVDDLQDNLDTFYKQLEGILQLSKASLGQWQVEQEYLADIECLVIRNYIWSIQQEFEEKLWDQNAKILSNERKISAEKMKEISCLRQELDIILKSLSPEVGHLISYSSMDSDHSHRKLLGNHMTPTLHREGNGKHEMSKTNLPENVDPSRLKHMGKDELINHFNTEMTKMSRNHESQVHEITEENFALKREILKEREKSSMLKKDREFDILRRKIPDIILKLDDILMENEKLRSSDANDENLGTMRNRLESLISENHHLKDLLGEKKKEIKCLSSQVSSHAEKMSQHSLVLSESLNTIEKLKCEMQEAQFEASICEDIVECFLREMMDESKCATEESAMRYDIMQGIYETVFEGASFVGELASTSENEHLDEESIVMQGLLGVVLQESLKEAEEKMISLHNRYMEEMSARLSIEKEVLHCGQALEIEIFNNKKLEAELISSRASLKEKEKLVQEITSLLKEEKEKLALAYEEVGSLKDQANSQEILILKSHEESNTTNFKLTEAMQNVGLLKVETCELKRKLEQAMAEFRKVDEDRRMLVATVSENQETKLLFEEKEKEHRKQMETVIFVVQELSKEVYDFEHRVIDYISRNNERLKRLGSETKSLIQDASMVKRDRLIYKQRLEKRCSDLQKAEAEVDLLGDEVDALLRLLEKMYIALDHYSPILKHYPGIVETLKLVKRELSGNTMEAF